ncbi:hypothetical protein BSL78_10154 [Apostichopus japonicus]|uniref:Ig-like domain-containing protein n=1 Tax=Stichopus japonicus TaxID=307972 RepID=A0A2G8KY96_STIJA|nr:hypothetical protein BSL78_10154 [Apostichopus japonicus]
MEMNLAFKLSVIIALFVINSSQEEMKYGEFKEVEVYTATSFPFGSIVGLYCVQGTDKGIEVFNNDNTAIKIVKNSTLQQEFSNTYQFEVINATTALFKIKNLTTQINGSTFTCLNPKQLSAKILGFKPINDVNPLCSSSYPSRFIFEDSVQNDIKMSCSSEEGDPPVMMSTYIRDGDEIVTSSSTRTVSSHPHSSKTLSFSSYFNSSFNNSVFVCNVSQQLPAPYQSYQGSCSFGPILFLPLFSVTATPSSIDLSDIRNAVFRCSSNVSEVKLSWTKIPTHWKYDVKESDASIQLNVLDTGSGVYSVNIQCVGYYGDRVITTTAHLSYSPLSVLETNLAIYLTLVIITIVVVCVVVVFLLSRVYVTNIRKNKDLIQMDDASVDVLPGILPTENYVNINSSSFTYDSGGYLSPCEPLQDDEQYDIVK